MNDKSVQKDIEIIRLSGSSRFDTAVAVSNEGWQNGAENAILANGGIFADALAGVPLAYALDAPVLITANKNQLEENVLSEIKRLSPKNIIILGGYSSVNKDIELQLKGEKYNIKRIFGATRFETAVLVACELYDVNGKYSEEVFITCSESFADTLAAGPVAAKLGSPILFVKSDGLLDEAVCEYIKNSSHKKAVILGGEISVKKQCEDSLKELGLSVTRISGNSRYDTAFSVLNKYESVFESNLFAFATGKDFPDALAGGAFAAKMGIPLITVDSLHIAEGLLEYIDRKNSDKVYVFGGRNSVSNVTLNRHLRRNIDDESVTVFGIPFEKYNYFFDKFNYEDAIDYADNLIDNNVLAVHPRYDAYPNFDINNFDWNISYTSAANTFQLYLQALMPLVYLTKSYRMTNNIKYLEYGEKLIDAWIKYKDNKELSSVNAYAWNDHGVSMRCYNLIYYALIVQNTEYFNDRLHKKLINLFNESVDYLIEDKNYFKNCNHGIFEDEALLYLAYVLDGPNKQELIKLAEHRLDGQIAHAFTDEMVHTENSTAYHLVVLQMIMEIGKFLAQFGDKWGIENYEKAKSSSEYLMHATMPDGYTAEIGDSPFMVLDLAKKINHSGLNYAVTAGKQGEAPQELRGFYPKSGYYYKRTGWKRDSTWMMFKSGYRTRTHKHADDLSLMLFSKGYEILCDSGYYNYIFADPGREFYISSSAHNTVVPDGLSYPTEDEKRENVGIAAHSFNEKYDYVSGYNDMYFGIAIDRHIYNFGDMIIVYDNILSNENHNYSQIFHLREKMKLISSSDSEAVYSIADTGYNVRIKQLLDGTKSETLFGGKSFKGNIAYAFGKLTPAHCLEFKANGDNFDYVTVITVENSEGESEGISSYSFNSDDRNFKIVFDDGAEEEIRLTPRDRITADQITITDVENGVFSFTNEFIHPFNNCEYGWELRDFDNGALVYQSGFSKNRSKTVDISKLSGKKFVLRSAVKGADRQEKSSNAAVIEYNFLKKAYKEVTSCYPMLNLRVTGQNVTALGDNEYQFSVDYESSLNVTLNFLIYRNGSSYCWKQVKNGNKINYTFTEPGTYSIMYYIFTNHKEKFFYTFEQIEIK